MLMEQNWAAFRCLCKYSFSSFCLDCEWVFAANQTSFPQNVKYLMRKTEQNGGTTGISPECTWMFAFGVAKNRYQLDEFQG